MDLIQSSRKEDCGRIVDEALESIKGRQMDEACSILMAAETETRRKQNPQATTRIIEEVLSLCLKDGQIEQFRQHLREILQRPGQMKQVIAEIIRKVISFPETAYNETILKTVKQISQGKLFVECERAEVTLRLARIMEDKGQMEEAANEIFEIPIETFGSVSKENRISFLLRQMELALKTSSYTKMEQTSTKITTKTFENNYLPEKKAEFLCMMAVLQTGQRKYISAAEYCLSLLLLSCTSNVDRENIFDSLVWLCMLSEEFDQRSAVLAEARKQKEMQQSVYSTFAFDLARNIFINRDQIEIFNKNKDSFLSFVSILGHSKRTILAEEAWKTLQERIVEHNIRAVSCHYSSISFSSLALYLELSEEKAEEAVCSMIIEKKGISSAIDRLSKTIFFYEERPHSYLQKTIEGLVKINRFTSALNME